MKPALPGGDTPPYDADLARWRQARRLRALVLAAGLAAMAVALSVASAARADSGLPIPRFVTVSAGEANLRTGPGGRYPIEWVLVRPQMPVEVIGEFDTWRQIRDWEGVEGWVHQSLLSGRRGMIVLGDRIQDLRSDPEETAAAVARLEPGVIGRLLLCPPPQSPRGRWCYCEISGYRGWLPRAVLWGVYADEEIE